MHVCLDKMTGIEFRVRVDVNTQQLGKARPLQYRCTAPPPPQKRSNAKGFVIVSPSFLVNSQLFLSCALAFSDLLRCDPVAHHGVGALSNCSVGSVGEVACDLGMVFLFEAEHVESVRRVFAGAPFQYLSISEMVL